MDDHPSYILDTNVLLQCSDFSQLRWPHPSFVVLIPHGVLLDLDRIQKRFRREIVEAADEKMRNDIKRRRDRAESATQQLTRLARNDERIGKGHLRFVAPETPPLIPSDPNNCDLHIISVAREVQKHATDCYSVFITFDRICFLLARSYGVNAVHLQKLDQLNDTIEANFQSWKLGRATCLEPGSAERGSTIFEFGKLYRLAGATGAADSEVQLIKLHFTSDENYDSVVRRKRISQLRDKAKERYPVLSHDYATSAAFLRALCDVILENVDPDATELLHRFEEEENLVLKAKGRTTAVLNLLKKQICAGETILVFDQNREHARQLYEAITKEREVAAKFGEPLLCERGDEDSWNLYEAGQTGLLVASELPERLSRSFRVLICVHCNVPVHFFADLVKRVRENGQSLRMYLLYMNESFSCEQEALVGAFTEVFGMEIPGSLTPLTGAA